MIHRFVARHAFTSDAVFAVQVLSVVVTILEDGVVAEAVGLDDGIIVSSARREFFFLEVRLMQLVPHRVVLLIERNVHFGIVFFLDVVL